LGDTVTQFLNQALRGTGYNYGFNLELFEANFDKVEGQVFDEFAKENHYKFIKGEYLPTPKNTRIKITTLAWAFERPGEQWILDITSHKSKTTYIKMQIN